MIPLFYRTRGVESTLGHIERGAIVPRPASTAHKKAPPENSRGDFGEPVLPHGRTDASFS